MEYLSRPAKNFETPKGPRGTRRQARLLIFWNDLSFIALDRIRRSNPRIFAMKTKHMLSGLLATTLLSTVALAQSQPAQVPAARAQTTTAQVQVASQWRASKLIGLNVYNGANEKIGDINEIILAPGGKVAGVVVGVGGFLGMGEHDVMLPLDKVKFVNEPVRTSSTTTTTRPAPTTGSGSATVPARPARAANEKWYPDHAMVNATKDQLKAMPQFKYN